MKMILDIEIDGKVSLNDKMGFLTTVDDARKIYIIIYFLQKKI